jgi:two-component system, NarL family, invasion response regulator UvrY
MKILLVDDQPIVRLGLEQVLQKEFAGAQLSEACGCREALELIRNEGWDLVVLELSIAGADGLEVLNQIKSARPDVPVLVLTMFSEERFGILALKEGASGFLSKRVSTDELAKAIRKTAEGASYVSASLAERLAQEISGRSQRQPHKNLSTREFQVLVKIASGMSVTEIAEELSISPKTVRQFRAGLLRKMNMNNDVELAHYAIRNELVD